MAAHLQWDQLLTKRDLSESLTSIRQVPDELTRGHTDSIQISKIRNEKGAITIDTEDIKTKIIRSYYKSLYSIKLENLDEIDNFLGRCQVPKLNQDQINGLNNLITPKEIETIINSLIMVRIPVPNGFNVEVYQA